MSLMFLNPINKPYFEKVKEKTGIDLSNHISFDMDIFYDLNCKYPELVKRFINTIVNIIVHNNIHAFSCEQYKENYSLNYSKGDWNDEYIIVKKELINDQYEITICVQNLFGAEIEDVVLKQNTLIYNYFNAIFEFFKLYNNTPMKNNYE